MNIAKLIVKATGAVLLITFVAACAGTSTNSKIPETTHDGLQLTKSSRHGAVYIKPGAQFDDYHKFGVVPCQIAFQKNWMRDQNEGRMSLDNRVTQRDVDRIKNKLAEQCDKYFRQSLQDAPAYTLVEEFSEGEAVLLLRPNIINLDVTAPDLRTTGMSRNYTASSGQMTLYLELLDGTTGDILARVVDSEAAQGDMRVSISNSVTNLADADRILKSWGAQLRAGLDSVRRQ